MNFFKGNIPLIAGCICLSLAACSDDETAPADSTAGNTDDVSYIGKAVGRRYGDSVTGGQALGQKNTGVGIWLTMTYLNPVAAIAPCAYVVWQNTLNSWQLWCKDKYGKLKW